MELTDKKIGYELLAQLVGLNFHNVETEYADVSGGMMRIRFNIDKEDVSTSAFGLIFALGVLSFHDARPRGMSEMDYEEEDDWQVADMLKNICFERGVLRFYADYVRGRMLKTRVKLDQDGKVELQTSGRARVAEGWIRRLKGKHLIELADQNT